MNNFQRAVRLLSNEKPFYSAILMSGKLIMTNDDKRMPTACVSYSKNSGLVFKFNTNYLDKHTTGEIAGLIIHECDHALHKHPMYFNNRNYSQHAMNIAMDCAINQYIPEKVKDRESEICLPPNGVTLTTLSAMLKESLEPEQTCMYYYNKIMNSPNVEKISVMSAMDEHGSGEDGGDILQDVPDSLKDIVSQALAKAMAEEAAKKSKGDVPKHLMGLLGAVSQHELPWNVILKNFIAKCKSNTVLHTIKKPNRRFGFDAQGVKKKRELTLAVCFDSSGSVSDAEYTAFFNEIEIVSKQCTKTILIEADCEVHDVVTIKKNSKINRKRGSGGGTAYQPAITEAIKHKPDAIIYFGDFDCADTPSNPNIPFLWVGVRDQEPPAKFGSVVRIKNV